MILVSGDTEDEDSADSGVSTIVERADPGPGPETAGREVEDAAVETIASISGETSQRDRITRERFA